MSISDISSQNNNYVTYYNKTSKAKSEENFTMSSATTQVNENNDSEVLGLSMIKDENSNLFYGMRAQYAQDSTTENPIIQVTSNYGGETVSYNVNINEVNPKNASKLEMFALCSYADDVGKGTQNTFGSYNVAKYYENNAEDNKYINSAETFESFKNEKFNWEEMCSMMMKDYYNAGIFGQFKEGQGLMDLFSQFPRI